MPLYALFTAIGSEPSDIGLYGTTLYTTLRDAQDACDIACQKSLEYSDGEVGIWIGEIQHIRQA